MNPSTHECGLLVINKAIRLYMYTVKYALLLGLDCDSTAVHMIYMYLYVCSYHLYIYKDVYMHTNIFIQS